MAVSAGYSRPDVVRRSSLLHPRRRAPSARLDLLQTLLLVARPPTPAGQQTYLHENAALVRAAGSASASNPRCQRVCGCARCCRVPRTRRRQPACARAIVHIRPPGVAVTVAVKRRKRPPPRAGTTSVFRFKTMEATTGFEPVMGVLQTPALPLGYVAVSKYPANACLGPQSAVVPRRRFELLHPCRARPPQDRVSAYSTTSAQADAWAQRTSSIVGTVTPQTDAFSGTMTASQGSGLRRVCGGSVTSSICSALPLRSPCSSRRSRRRRARSGAHEEAFDSRQITPRSTAATLLYSTLGYGAARRNLDADPPERHRRRASEACFHVVCRRRGGIAGSCRPRDVRWHWHGVFRCGLLTSHPGHEAGEYRMLVKAPDVHLATDPPRRPVRHVQDDVRRHRLPRTPRRGPL